MILCSYAGTFMKNGAVVNLFCCEFCSDMQHILCNYRNVKAPGNIKVYPRTCLNGSAVTNGMIIRILIVGKFKVLEAMSCKYVGLNKRFRVFKKVVQHTPADMNIRTPGIICEIGGKIIEKPVGVDPV